MAKKPPKPDDDDPVTSDQSVISGDFVSGPTPGEWGTGWRVLWAQASNVPNSPGGAITVYDVPEGFRTGVEDGRNKIECSSHGEWIRSQNSRNRYFNLNKLKAGDYSSPGTAIPWMDLRIEMGNFQYGDDSILLTILLNTNDFDDGEQVSISVSKTTVTISGSSLPFSYYDMLNDITKPYSEGGGDLGVTVDHDFEFVIDK